MDFGLSSGSLGGRAVNRIVVIFKNLRLAGFSCRWGLPPPRFAISFNELEIFIAVDWFPVPDGLCRRHLPGLSRVCFSGVFLRHDKEGNPTPIENHPGVEKARLPV